MTHVRIASCRIAAIALLAGSCGGSPTPRDATIAEVIDGDTIVLASGDHVRLVQIDAPELAKEECYAREAAKQLGALLPVGTTVRLEADDRLDNADRYGRALRYVFAEGLNINLELVTRGAAAPYFYRGERGRYADDLLQAAARARDDGRGLWGACPATTLAPDRQVDARP